MFKLYLTLFYEFVKTGAFAIGGGYAALPFLFYMQSKYNWFSLDELTGMIAVSNITPGPIGINMATYTGFKTAGIFGSLLATTGIVLVPFCFVIIMAKLLNKYKTAQCVNYMFEGLRPAACALLASIGLKLLIESITASEIKSLSFSHLDYGALLLFSVLIIPFSIIKKNPLLAITAGAAGGIIIKSFM